MLPLAARHLDSEKKGQCHVSIFEVSTGYPQSQSDGEAYRGAESPHSPGHL